MKVAFVQEEIRTRQGVMILSSMLKKHGHVTDVFARDEGDEKTLHSIGRFKPHIVAFSTLTPAQKSALGFARWLKSRNKDVFIIMGGPHPTFYPKVLEENNSLDAICIGEGEYAILELADNIGNNGRIIGIKNLWIRGGNKIYKNELRPLVENLDELPDPDREIYYKKFPQLENSNTKIFMAGRGCPFPCSYCFNKRYMDMYKKKGTYIRYKSIAKIIDEIKRINEKYPLKWIQFNDDTFNLNKKWLYPFLEEYEREFKIGFLCNLRVDLVDEELIKRLKSAGLDRVNIGIEHGNEEFRREILKRNISNKDILNTARLLHKYDIRIHTDNIVGFPEETLDLAFETVRINQRVNPEQAGCGVLQPFPGTDIYDYALSRGLLKKGVTIDDFTPQRSWTSGQPKVSALIENPSMNQLINLHCFFDLLVHHPRLEPLCRILIKLPPNRFYQFISQWGMFKVYFKYADGLLEKLRVIKRALSLLWKK